MYIQILCTYQSFSTILKKRDNILVTISIARIISYNKLGGADFGIKTIGALYTDCL
jgi:hypothetical protein